MKTANDSGHTKNVHNFETMIITCIGFNEAYNPSNLLLSIAKLQERCLLSRDKLQMVKGTEAPYHEAVGQRKLSFSTYKSTTTKIMNSLKASSVSPTTIANAESIFRKIQGKRANKTVLKTKEGDEVKKVNSVSQQSFDMQIDNYEKFIELLALVTEYQPNEKELQLKNLLKMKQDMQERNIKVKTVYVPYKNALLSRDLDLYDPVIGLVATAQMVKAYVKSVFGAQSPQYKQISGLRFITIRH